MRKLFLLLIIGISLTGCSTLACLADEDCRKGGKPAFDAGKAAGAFLGAFSANPAVATTSGFGGGALAFIVYAIRKKYKKDQKKKEEEDGANTR